MRCGRARVSRGGGGVGRHGAAHDHGHAGEDAARAGDRHLHGGRRLRLAAAGGAVAGAGRHPRHQPEPRVGDGERHGRRPRHAPHGRQRGPWRALGGAQVDRFGNLNTLVMGDYREPERRLGGTGGNTEIACMARRVLTVMPQERRRFVERVNFNTSPGYIDGPGARARAGLGPQGPNAVVSTFGVFAFDTPDGATGSCEMVLERVFPNMDPDIVRLETGWDLRVAPNITEVPPPTGEELTLLRRLDPHHFYLTPGRY
ncbi:MAG: hypothetical protein IPG47_08175 [Thermoflexaceae bacterium]|nr:hypothetical protein [Thermoflexaceae bacterium]